MAANRTLTRQREELEREWERWANPAAIPSTSEVEHTALRDEVALSWRRSLRTVDPSCTVAPGLDDVAGHWARSPLREPVTRLGDQLRAITEDAGYVAAVTDSEGTIVWTCGDRTIRRQGESINFAPGGHWDESRMGTNGLSLALHTGRPTTVFSAEHLVAALHGWVCYSAPIHAADGRRLGVLDLSSRWDRSHPAVLTSVRALVTAAETILATATPVVDGIRLECLGTAGLIRDGVLLALPPRRLEILTLLALEPRGYTPDQLHIAVYGDRAVSSSTLKADVSHLRRATGGRIATRRYGLTAALSCDAVDLLDAVAIGDIDTAVRLYRGPLLPGSQAPGIAQWREHIDVAVRTAVLASTHADHAVTFGQHAPDDAQVHEHALALLGPTDTRRPVVAARLHAALRP